MVEFQCNICETANHCAEASFSREGAFCSGCHSTVRMRAAIAALSLALYGQVYAISRFPERPRFRGLGMSDWAGYSARLRRAVDYRNTYFAKPPARGFARVRRVIEFVNGYADKSFPLDITAIPERERGRSDFLISIDVFEHVPPPVSRAFEGAAALLKPGGALILSAPYTLDDRTVEHFPNLHEYELAERCGVTCLINKTADGRMELFDDLRFHGGPGMTLEMRVFCKQHIERLLKDAGFGAVHVVDRIAEYGIIYDNPCSQTFIARRSLSS